MKIDEIMLGDIVSVSGRPIHVTLAVLNHWSDNIEPIPLTPEILEKNGFRDSYADACLNEDGVYNFSDWYGHYVIIDMNENELTVKFDNKVLVCLSYRNVIKVHQLQQVLRLCDIKKDITL